MSIIIKTQLQFKPSIGYGYYQGARLFQFSDPEPPYMIDDIAVFAFTERANPNKWWIGASDQWDRGKWTPIGPYESAEDAMVMIKLLGKPR